MRDVTAIHLTIHGKVQGVGYRAWAGATARKHNLKGWVRNHVNGTVEMVLIGAPQVVQQMIDASRNGPSNAHVEAIDVAEWTDFSPIDFRQLPTVS